MTPITHLEPRACSEAGSVALDLAHDVVPLAEESEPITERLLGGFIEILPLGNTVLDLEGRQT